MKTYLFSDSTSNFPRTCGIYAIKRRNQYLVGQTNRPFFIRFREHRLTLKNNKHDNPYLQNSFNKYNENEFEFLVLEESERNLNQKETLWIEKLKSMKNQKGWNMREGGAFGKYGESLRRKVSKGIRNSKKAAISREKTRKLIALISPNGEKVSCVGIRQFCKQYKLTPACIWRLQSGKVSHHKGWKLSKQ
jgi:hypothetical protein